MGRPISANEKADSLLLVQLALVPETTCRDAREAKPGRSRTFRSGGLDPDSRTELFQAADFEMDTSNNDFWSGAEAAERSRFFGTQAFKSQDGRRTEIEIHGAENLNAAPEAKHLAPSERKGRFSLSRRLKFPETSKLKKPRFDAPGARRPRRTARAFTALKTNKKRTEAEVPSEASNNGSCGKARSTNQNRLSETPAIKNRAELPNRNLPLVPNRALSKRHSRFQESTSFAFREQAAEQRLKSMERKI